VHVERYLETVRERLQSAGFREETPPSSATLKARRRETKLTRSGIVETVIVIRRVVPAPAPAELQAFGADCVRSALDGKTRIPRGLGSSLVVYPVVVVDSVSAALVHFLNAYAPKRWALLEFPVAVDVTTSSLAMRTTTPLWGGAYYEKTRNDARALLEPIE
jgi:hypothetical protein